MPPELAPAPVPPRDVDVDELVRSHLPLVDHLVRETVRRIPAHVDRDDLASAGYFALAAAARSFDPSLGVPFGGFASLRIRGALTDELRSMDWATRSVRAKGRAVDVAQESLTQSLGRLPTAVEVAKQLDMTLREYADLRADVHRATVLRSDAPGTLEGVTDTAERADGPEELLLRCEQLGYLRDAIAELPDRLRTVVEQYFFGQRRMSDIARELGVTESRVSQLRSEAIVLLREGMTCSDAGDEAPRAEAGTGRRGNQYREAVARRSTPVQRLSRAASHR